MSGRPTLLQPSPPIVVGVRRRLHHKGRDLVLSISPLRPFPSTIERSRPRSGCIMPKCRLYLSTHYTSILQGAARAEGRNAHSDRSIPLLDDCVDTLCDKMIEFEIVYPCFLDPTSMEILDTSRTNVFALSTLRNHTRAKRQAARSATPTLRLSGSM